MEKTPTRTTSSLGMFDLLKGVGMLTIVFAHTAESYSMGTTTALTPFTFYLFAYRESLMAAFYIASGYGFRKRSIGKCVSQQLQMLLKPYLITGLATTVLHFLCHYAAFGSLESAFYETRKVFGGFALGLPHTAEYFGQTFFSCGPMWYLLALMIGWILLDIILNIFPEPYIPWVVLGTMTLGWGITLAWNAPFCIAQGMVVVPYLYLGFLAKKHKLFEKPFSRRLKRSLWAAFVLVGVIVVLTQRTDCVSLGEWTIGPFSILLDSAVGLGLLAAFLKAQRKFDNVFTRAVQSIGRRSLYIFCVHTVELTAIPWYLMADKFVDMQTVGLVVQFAVSLGSVLLVCELLSRRRDWKIQRVAQQRRRAEAHKPYVARH